MEKIDIYRGFALVITSKTIFLRSSVNHVCSVNPFFAPFFGVKKD